MGLNAKGRPVPTEEQLIAELMAFIAGADGAEAAFDRLALQLFAYQFERNPPFRRFATQRGRTIRTVRNWRDIPAVPISAFKDLTLCCRPPESAERIFMTSGTTREGVRGKSFHTTLEVYDASMTTNFGRRVMAGREPIRMGILFPSEQAMPNSSLAHYLALAARHFGTPESHHLIDASGLDETRLLAELTHAEATGEPYALLGASYGFVPVLDALARRSQSFALPEGSWLLETNAHRELGAARFRVVAYDFGIKHNSLRLLADRGCEVQVVPATTPASEVLAREPDGVFLSNGPGDP